MASTTSTRSTKRPLFVRPELRKELLLAVLVIIAATLLPGALGLDYWSLILLTANLYLIAAIGLNLLMAEAGQISFGHGVIFGAAAYASAMAYTLAELSFVASALVGILAGLATGLVLSAPALRVQGYYLAFVTMAAALAFPEVLLIFDEYTQATTGILAFVPGLTDTLFWNASPLTLIILGVSVISLCGYALIRSSSTGRDMRMTGFSPEAGATLGMHPGRKRVMAFGISSFIAAIAGVLYVPLIGYVSPTSFTIDMSVTIFLAVVVGGKGTIMGPIVGVGVVYLIPDAFLTQFRDYRLIIFGVVAYLVMALLPDGIVGNIRKIIDRRRATNSAEAVNPMKVLETIAAHPPAETASGASLQASGVEKSFGSVRALRGATLEVAPGELHGIVGPNGSGKTSLLNVLSGLYTPEQGRVELNGVDVTRESIVHRASLGLGRTFQTPRVIDELSAWENVDLGPKAKNAEQSMIDIIQSQRDLWDPVPGGSLSHAQRRLLEVARVMNRGANLWLLDEPAAGLSQTERSEFGDLLRAVNKAWGTTIILVEHDLELVWSIADRISVVEGGRVVASGTPQEIDEIEEVRHIFQGVRHADG